MKVKTFIAGNATEQIQLHPNLTCINHLQPEVEEPFDFSMYYTLFLGMEGKQLKNY